MAAYDSSLIDQAALKRALHYDPETGVFTWRKRVDVPAEWNTRRAGKPAGTLLKRNHSEGCYLAIRVNGRSYLAHRLAWLYMRGEWPPEEIDHADGNGLNNAIRNLRLATRSQQRANQKLRKDSRIGFKGVKRYVGGNRKRPYFARLKVAKRARHLGSFETPEEAHQAYCQAAIEKLGEFARFE